MAGVEDRPGAGLPVPAHVERQGRVGRGGEPERAVLVPGDRPGGLPGAPEGQPRARGDPGRGERPAGRGLRHRVEAGRGVAAQRERAAGLGGGDAGARGGQRQRPVGRAEAVGAVGHRGACVHGLKLILRRPGGAGRGGHVRSGHQLDLGAVGGGPLAAV